MNSRTKTRLIQLAGLLLCLVCAAAGVLWHMDQQSEPVPQTPGVTVPDNDLTVETEPAYDPLSEIEHVTLEDSVEIKTYDYYEHAKNYTMTSTLKSQGYRLTEASYDKADTKVGILSTDFKFPAELSQTTHKVTKPITSEGAKGGYETKNETVTEDCPVLVPYYGYIIYTAKGSTMLLDSNCRVLMRSFNGYTPAYMTDYCGNPLFKKNDKYYFYYTGKNYGGAAYSEIENEDFTKLPATPPTAYQYFTYDIDMLNNLFVTNDFKNESNMDGIVYILPDYAGMVEFALDEDTLNDILLPSESYNREEGELFRFPSYTYTKTESKQVNEKPYYTFEVTNIFWGYMDAEGNTAIEPQFKKAYNFTKDGLAVVEDRHGHLCVINKKGSVVYNYYDTIHYFPELGNQKIRDGHYIPDTFGVESSGMLWLDRGYVRMRRKLVDTVNGYTVKRETQTLVDAKGMTVNLPTDFTLVGYADGVMLLQRGDKYGYMTAEGAWIIQPTLAYAKPFSEGLAVMGYAKDKLGVIDTEGNIVLYPMYQHIESCSGGVITAYSAKGGWTVYNKMTTAGMPKAVKNPIISLKKRAIAEAKYQFYTQKETTDELPSGQS